MASRTAFEELACDPRMSVATHAHDQGMTDILSVLNDFDERRLFEFMRLCATATSLGANDIETTLIRGFVMMGLQSAFETIRSQQEAVDAE